jgi:DMSO/TMAO reductase YedYZ molybdopterin-dependent catalytic subunit
MRFALWLMLTAARIAVAAEPSSVSNELLLSGEVRHELRLSPDDVREIAKRRGIAEDGTYRGVRLVDLLAEAQLLDDAPLALRRTYVVAVATDGYPAVFSWGELFNTAVGRGVIVATDRDAVPLREGEGRLALVSLADTRPGPRHVKWLARIEVRRIPEGATRK